MSCLSMSCLCLLLLLLLCSRISCSFASSAACSRDVTNYSFHYSFSSDSSDGLVLLRDAEISNGALHLTPGPRNSNRSGAALLAAPVTLWSQNSEGFMQNASFDTSFTMNFPYSSPAGQEAAGPNGEGLAFVVVPTLNSPPLGILGLRNNPPKDTSSASRGTGFFLVKFFDMDDNRSRLNISIITSAASLVNTMSIATNQTTTKNYKISIKYTRQHVGVYMDDKPVLEADLNLNDNVLQRAFFGFLFSSELHSILSWELTVKLPGNDNKDIDWKVTLPAVLGCISVTAIMKMFVAAFYFKSKYNKLKMELVLSETLRRLPGMPREFKHATMRKATDNFHEARRLGKGGFGAVYKGTLWSGKDGMTCVEVAVKKFTGDENRRYDDFLAEIDIINRLRHRNIVPLVGWCYEKGELLLIYEYMPNGSLDQHLCPKEQPQRILGWATRYDIVADIAAGLHYVHHEHEHMVLHRDIKASNIMLDSTFRARLGDFGLARIVGLDKNSYTDLGVAGTWGFIAPEYSVSHKATRRTDVYAFGVLVLEILTGRRALCVFQDTFQLLTDWVWRLHQEGRLLEAVDKKVVSTEEYDADGATRLLLLGLACTNPNPLDRPTMAEAVQVVAKSAPAPDVPHVKPSFVWPPEEGMPQSFDDITEMSDLDESHWEETSSSDALAVSAIIRRKARVSSIG
ncbi:hypothetical protein SEVIR_7G047800v4 [Setaria viridis]|uniref:Protein kinase domain-containing protein n=1 Tax=Setaria viridis TaxID=4556 RepID=A0A4U6TQA2_SETVI|nr:probable L-type lectin-domain containing receptor kinase S.5 [Setaria viridis]TKW03535.1 hypothetical protein SEVIR_7G047800v2 [Setaria viridis]